MIKFWVTTRPLAGVAREEFDYHWGVVHTSLMVTTPSVLNGNFRRYTQHRSVIDAITDDMLMYKRSAERWYSCADHLCANHDELIESVVAGDVKRRVFNFRFSDKAMVVELTDTACLFDSAPTRLDAGGVKLINHIKRAENVSQSQFTSWWRSEYAPLLERVAGASRGGPVHRYDQNASVSVNPEFFSGSLFELGNAGTYAGIEELWFDDLASLCLMRTDESVCAALKSSATGMIDAEASFSMPVVERVVFDFTGEFADHAPAVRDPQSVERRMYRSERAPGSWNAIRQPYSEKVAGE
jgi:EthD domain